MTEDHPGSLGGVIEGINDELGHKGGGEREVRRGKLLSARNEVGRLVNSWRLAAPEVAGPAQPCDNLVAHQQYVMALAHLAHCRVVPHRRDDDAAGTLQGLRDEAGDSVWTPPEDLGLKLVRQPGHKGGFALAWSRIPVIMRRRDMRHKVERQARADAAAMNIGQPSERACCDSDAMVSPLARDEIALLGLTACVVVAPNQPHLRVVRIGATLAEKDLAAPELRWRFLDESGRKLLYDGHSSVGKAVVVGEAAHLRGRRLDQLLVCPSEPGAP
mmetsp:Transcript_4904/g.14863  ORF Transcript_4904/g.14863 Transcript_4904/m.14863 type:complete len:273 (-) Transcript_4904:257-1075(-)|eukprot:scaffold174525_cov33-Tisochrysis_lutea.AAC.2